MAVSQVMYFKREPRASCRCPRGANIKGASKFQKLKKVPEHEQFKKYNF